MRHGTTNRFAALNVGTVEVIGVVKFMDIAVAPYGDDGGDWAFENRS